MKIAIARALKLKNRLAEKIGKLDARIGQSNSYRLDLGQKEIAWDLLAERQDMTDRLVELKAAVARANFDIQNKIFRMAELKGLIALVGRLDTTEGKTEKTNFGYRNETSEIVEYGASINQKLATECVEKFQSELDTLQDEVDAFNATHEVELSF